jgi:adenosylcobinamide kinase/adenosylcobinamide-phosphate guanylyltransferase
MGNLTLILGGARSGKSTFAERLASDRGQAVTYIATAQALDDEMLDRIAVHKASRPTPWRTMEIPTDIAGAIKRQPIQTDIVLLDCLTLLVSNLVLQATLQADIPDEERATLLVESELEGLKTAILTGSEDWIVVSNEVGMGLVPPYPLGRVYRDLLGWANQQVAFFADEIYFLLAGIPMRLTPWKAK